MGPAASRFSAFGWVLVAAWLLLGIRAVMGHVGGGFPIRQVGAEMPTIEMQTWWWLWWTLGTGAALALARALFVATESNGATDRLAAHWARGSDRAWIAATAALAFALAVVVSQVLLGGRHIVVDESAYLFMARVLATGRLTIDSYVDSGFYDRGFMVNDGKMYAQYFVGWPAMLAPFAVIGLEAFANPVWSAATVPGVFLVVRRLAGSPWARAGALLFATAPITVFAASTQMAHTACTFCLVWALWFAFRGRDDESPWWAPFGLAVAFSVAFFVRPTTALGIGGPILAWWVWGRVGRADGQRIRDALAFAAPAAALAAAFLYVNKAQTGDPFMVAYTRAAAFTLESAFLQDQGGARALYYTETWRLGTGPLNALYRLNYALLGWPSSFFFVPFALRAPGARLFAAMSVGMLAMHAFVSDPGIMAYGPVHYIEMVIPVVVLTVLGARELSHVEAPEWAGRAGLSFLVALCLVSVAGYWPWRLQNLGRIGKATAIPYDLVEDLPLAVVFTRSGRWLPHCVDERVHAYHTSRPDNPPDLDARLVWVNHATVVLDKGFVRHHYPGRKGLILDWDEACQPRLIDIKTLGPFDYPPSIGRKGVAPFQHLRAPLKHKPVAPAPPTLDPTTLDATTPAAGEPAPVPPTPVPPTPVAPDPGPPAPVQP